MKTYTQLICLFGLLLIFMNACSTAKNNRASNQLSSKEVRKLLKKSPELVIIDVRTPEEFNQGHLKNAINHDVKQADFTDKIEALNKNKTYLLYCRTGNRSGKAQIIMSEKQFSSVYNSTAGFEELKKEGLAVE